MEDSNNQASHDIEIPLLEASIREDLRRLPPLASDIEIPLLEASIREELRRLPPLAFDSCISRVPERLRCVNEKAYTPTVVSIGPLHHGEDALEVMEEHKRRYLQDFVDQSQVGLEDYIKCIRDQEARLRSCYAETIEFSSHEFVKIILVDATFIIELFLKSQYTRLQQRGDHIFNKPMMINDVRPDLLLLENQLPFFIFEELLDLHNSETASPHSDSVLTLSMVSLTLNFFDCFLHLSKAKEYNLESVLNVGVQIEHFVDFIRKLCLPVEIKEAGGQIKSITTPSITQLHQAGVRFMVAQNETCIFGLDIQFTNVILIIPKIRMVDRTEAIIRNLIAFEQCHCTKIYINDYATIMDGFVNTPKDVELLVKYGIVESMLGDSSVVSTMINSLGNGVISDFDDFCYANLREELHKHCNSSWHKWRANLRQNYFNTPWATISVIAAVFLIILTLIQTVCSIISLTK